MYSIKLLQKAIDDHQKEIDKLSAIESELAFEEVFKQEEIAERKEYIKQISESIKLLK
jgi:hypothetical protein